MSNSTHSIRTAQELSQTAFTVRPSSAHVSVRLPWAETEHWRDNRRRKRDCRLSRRIFRAISAASSVQSLVLDLPGVYLHNSFFSQLQCGSLVHISLANLSFNFTAANLIMYPFPLVSLSLSRLSGVTAETIHAILDSHSATLQSLTLHSLHIKNGILFTQNSSSRLSPSTTITLPALTRLNIRQTHASPYGLFHLISQSSLLASLVVSLSSASVPAILATYICHHQYHLFPLLARVHIEGWDWQLHPHLPNQFKSLPHALGIDYVSAPTKQDIAEYNAATVSRIPKKRKRRRKPSSDRLALAQAVRLLHASAGHLTSSEIDSLISLVDAWNQSAPGADSQLRQPPHSGDEYIAVDSDEDEELDAEGISYQPPAANAMKGDGLELSDDQDASYTDEYDEDDQGDDDMSDDYFDSTMDLNSCDEYGEDDLELDLEDEDDYTDEESDESTQRHGTGEKFIAQRPKDSDRTAEKRYPVPPSLIRALSFHADRILATSNVANSPDGTESIFSSTASSSANSTDDERSNISEASPMREIEARVRNLEGKIDMLALTTNHTEPEKFIGPQETPAQLAARKGIKAEAPDLRAKMDFSLMLQREAEALQLEMDNLRSKAGGIMMADLDILD